MKYNELLGAEVSALGFGSMRMPEKDGKLDLEKTENLITQLYNEGVNYFDTAWMYHGGESEKVLCQILKKFPRESYYLADKLPVWFCNSPEEVPTLFETQLKRCQADYFDFYLVHSVTRDNWGQFEEYGVIPYLIQKKQEGIIHRLGFSFHGDAELLTEILDNYDCFEFIQLQLNYFDWDFGNAKRLHAIARERGLPIIVMEPVRGGVLADLKEANEIFLAYDKNASIASWAIRYAMNLEGVKVTLSGMSNEQQALDNVKNASLPPLTQEEQELIKAADKQFKSRIFIPCTGCRYCMDCTNGIDIPAVFKLYNEYTASKWNRSILLNGYPPLMEGKECIECGKCQAHCPQGISIIKELQAIAQKYEELKK